MKPYELREDDCLISTDQALPGRALILRLGFSPLKQNERFMEIHRPNLYKYPASLN